MFRFVLLLTSWAGLSVHAAHSPENALLDRWIARQAEIRTLSADFTQTRALRVLRSPVASRGHLWFQAPGDFRWQVGDPPKIIVLRKDNDVRVIEPLRKTVKIEALDLGRREAGLMEFPFVRSRADLEKRFTIGELKTEDPVCRVKLIPRDTQGFLTGVNLTFDTQTLHLLTLEMTFRDGSSLRNEFSNVQVNEKLPAGTFAFDTTGYREIDASR
jgi:outer membrane lipoprotein carrier protein